MNVSAIREAKRARPFRPFRLQLADGTEHEVLHPEWILVAPNGREVALYNQESRLSFLEPSQIASLEWVATARQDKAEADDPSNGVGPSGSS